MTPRVDSASRLVQASPMDVYRVFADPVAIEQCTPLDRTWIVDDIEVQHLLSQADRQLGRLDIYSQYVPNIELFTRMHVVKEAAQSSRIEGTQIRIEEALPEWEDVAAPRRDDWGGGPKLHRGDGARGVAARRAPADVTIDS